MIKTAYQALSTLASGVIAFWLDYRATKGKEDKTRTPERYGIASRPRPDGNLLWIHGASVGESLSVLSLINKLLSANPNLHILVTTGTVTSANLMAKRLPDRAFHQFIPLDYTPWINRFLSNWQPDGIIWIESELWPNTLQAIKAKNIPSVLVNGRMSEKSFKAWQKIPSAIKTLLSTFTVCMTQSEVDQPHFARLGANAKMTGNLKYSSDPLPCDPQVLESLQQAVGNRPVILFTSTHVGEEMLAGRITQQVQIQHPNLLTIIAPRHPARGGDIALEVRGIGLTLSQRSLGETLNSDTQVYLADTLGELGLFYRLSPIVVMGGSFIPHGGHNPIEPAQLNCAIILGAHMFNFIEITNDMVAAKATIHLTDTLKAEQDLLDALKRLLKNPDEVNALAGAAAQMAEEKRVVIDVIQTELQAVFPFLSSSHEKFTT